MRIEYDNEVDILYLQFGRGVMPYTNVTAEGENWEAVFDVDQEGKIRGIEILNASGVIDLSTMLPLEAQIEARRAAAAAAAATR